ncbi:MULTISPECIES: MAPEG family protein [Hyphobacterium]|uniref:MAPEG family protein n=1 Tax=Hyphobacterium vulgare TaxID=1736751 RepID=A0ABV6ZZD4_9PROT
MNTILAPVLALVGWTFVMWLWMYATRIPAMQAAKMNAAKLKQKSDLDPLPVKVKQIADNYNHLHEQPVLFYAVCLVIAALGGADSAALALAWAYVAIRVVHSLMQATINFVPARFAIFTLGSIVLFVLWLITALRVFAG